MSDRADPPYQTTPENGAANTSPVAADSSCPRARDGWSKTYLLMSAVIAVAFLLIFWGRDDGWGLPVFLAFPFFIAWGSGMLAFALIKRRPKLAASVVLGFALIASDFYTCAFTTVALDHLWLHLNKSRFDAQIAQARNAANGGPVRVELDERDLALFVTDGGQWMMTIYDETDQLMSDPNSVSQIIKGSEYRKHYTRVMHIGGHYYRVYISA